MTGLRTQSEGAGRLGHAQKQGAAMMMKDCFRVLVLSAAAAALSGCAGFPFGKTPPDTFDLTAPSRVEGPASVRRQILVTEPTALKALDSDKIVVHTSPSAIQYLSNSQWSDRLPNIVQAKLIQAFEDSGRVGGVGRPGDGLAIDYRVLSDIRAFGVSTVGTPMATVEISVKILNDRNGVVRTQKVFGTSAPVAGAGNDAFIAALDAAFDEVATEIVNWTLRQI
jgi:cholesterol transport system auxiliary component